jgi:hypothetical protein
MLVAGQAEVKSVPTGRTWSAATVNGGVRRPGDSCKYVGVIGA